jgi:hypothetical protein
VLSPDGTIKHNYELIEHARHIHPIGLNSASLPRNNPPTGNYSKMEHFPDQTSDSLSRREFMAALEPSISLLDDSFASFDWFDSGWAFQCRSNTEESPTEFGDSAFV